VVRYLAVHFVHECVINVSDLFLSPESPPELCVPLSGVVGLTLSPIHGRGDSYAGLAVRLHTLLNLTGSLSLLAHSLDMGLGYRLPIRNQQIEPCFGLHFDRALIPFLIAAFLSMSFSWALQSRLLVVFSKGLSAILLYVLFGVLNSSESHCFSWRLPPLGHGCHFLVAFCKYLYRKLSLEVC
jgi:hypothetical protein